MNGEKRLDLQLEQLHDWLVELGDKRCNCLEIEP